MPLQLDAEEMPVIGDTFIAVVCFVGKQVSVGVFWLHTVTESPSGRNAMDSPTQVIEAANNLVCHGSLMNFELLPDAGVYLWGGGYLQIQSNFLSLMFSF